MSAKDSDFISGFSELLEMENGTTIHIRNLKFLLTEVYKFLNGLSPPTVNEVFQASDCPEDLRNRLILASKNKSTIKYGINRNSFKGPPIWQKIPLGIRNLESLSLLKSNVKQIQIFLSRCKIGRLFTANLGYIDWLFYTMIPFIKNELGQF